MSKLDPAKFKKLQAKWNKKLKASGFQDIENDRGEFKDHKSINDFFTLVGFRTGFMESIRDYYLWAGRMANVAKFNNKRDQKVWLMHSDGLSARDIAKKVKLDHSMVSRDIKRIRRYLKLQITSDDDFDYLEGVA